MVRRMWELGNEALLFSYPKEEGKFFGEAKPRTLPAGRAQLVTRRHITLVQTGLVSAGLAASPAQAASSGVAPYPHLQAWLRA